MRIKLRKAKSSFCVSGRGLNHEDEIQIDTKSQKVCDKWEKPKKYCPYYYDFKRVFGEHLIAIDHAIQNSTDSVDLSGSMKDRGLVEPVDDLRLDKESSLIHHTNDELDVDGNKKKREDTEEQRLDCRQKQKVLRASNTQVVPFLI